MSEEVASVCEAIIETQTDENLAKFSDLTDALPTKMLDMSGSFTEKLLFLKDNKFFAGLLSAFKLPLSIEQQLRILKLWDIFFQTASAKEDYDILFSDNLTNEVILYAFEYNSEDVRQSYATVLKGISLKFKDFDHNLLIYNRQIPILAHSLPFINNQDSITVSAMRFVILNICLTTNETIREAICDKVSYAPIENLISDIDADGFAFLADFFAVAPTSLKNFTYNTLRKKIDMSPPAFFASALSFLTSSPAKSLLMDIIGNKINTWDLKDPAILGILLFALEKKLIKLDIAIRVGFISATVPLFDQSSQNYSQKFDLPKELASVMLELISPLHVAIILRILALLYDHIYSSVIDAKKKIIEMLKSEENQEVIKSIIYQPNPLRIRTDLEFTSKAYTNPSKYDSLMLMLAEIQNYCAKFHQSSFSWFEITTPNETQEVIFNLQNEGQRIVADGNVLRFNETEMPLKSCIVSLETKKYVTIKVVQYDTTKKFRIPQESNYSFDFESGNVAQAFIDYVSSMQKKFVDTMLDNLTSYE